MIIIRICWFAELFHTERTHVRNLKVLERVFYRPLLDNGFSDLVNLLFPNLPEMLEIHDRFNTLMKARKREQAVVETVGDILLAMVTTIIIIIKIIIIVLMNIFMFQFDGPSGETLQQSVGTFCKYQSMALESLKDRRKKESKLQVTFHSLSAYKYLIHLMIKLSKQMNSTFGFVFQLQTFLAEAEGNSVCRRLQLKDIIPTAMQRLTKYPLLLESLAKYTQARSELATVRKCLERSRQILNKVNQAIKEADNYNRLVDIQKRLDKSAFEKTDHPIANELKVLLFHQINSFHTSTIVFEMTIFTCIVFSFAELWTDEASTHLRRRPDVANERSEECRLACGTLGGVHPTSAEAGRQVRPQVPQYQLEFKRRHQVNSKSHHQDCHSPSSSRCHR